VGIDAYNYVPPLSGCVRDILSLEAVLARHANHTPNYDCKRLVSDEIRVTHQALEAAIKDLFAYDGEVVFAFAGHGVQTAQGAYLVTQEGHRDHPGILMNDLMAWANAAKAKEVVLLLDCCRSGAIGTAIDLSKEANISLSEGVTILAASRADEDALEADGHGMFTQLVVGALSGGAADVRGRISAAAVYAYVEEALGPWEQRPLYKSHASQLAALRYCDPEVTVTDLMRLTELFTTPDTLYLMDPTYEHTDPSHIGAHVQIFKLFKRYRDARLLKTTIDEDLYFAAMHRTPVALTPLGKYYWWLAKQHRLEADLVTPERTRKMPDAETVARLFHETYERLAPAYHYKTRRATAVSWDAVPDRNKQHMIATTAEVLAMLFPAQGPNEEQLTNAS
jgi:hypothetical protein